MTLHPEPKDKINKDSKKLAGNTLCSRNVPAGQGIEKGMVLRLL
jgi:hypothetical protein